jgi:hypothetical protein
MNARIGVCVTAAMLSWAVGAAADPVRLTSDLRTTIVLSHVADSSGDDRHTARDEAGDRLTAAAIASTGTSSAMSTATLTSSYADPLHMFGTGSANVSWNSTDLADVSSDAEFVVRFQLASPFTYAFDATFDTSGIGRTSIYGSSRGRWATQLTPFGGFSTPMFNDSGNDPVAARMYRGTLLPGEYSFLVDASGVGDYRHQGRAGEAHGAFNFTFDLTPVKQDPPSPTPEPSSLLLLGTGAVAILRTYRMLA